METRRLWYETVSSRDGSPSVIWSVAFSPDGSRLLVAVGSCLLVYDPVDAKVLQTLKAHKDTVYVVTYNKTGKLFASGGADRTVIVWTSPGAGWRKYSHSDSIQCLAFNPVTLQLASATSVDFGLWSPEVCSVGKQKLPARACCMDWTPNGNHLAIGLFSGIVSVRDTTGAEKWNVALSAPVWTLAWSPQQNEESFSIFLAVGTFCPELVFYRETGEACLPSQALDCDPLSISFAPSGNFFLVGGSNGSISIWSHDGVRLGTIGQLQDWVWACAVHPNSSQIIAGSNAGELHMYNVTFPVVHALYQDRYAHRERLTDVVVQHMQLEQSVRIRCRSLVKKVAIFKESLAILLPGEVVLYSADQRNPDDMKYRETARIKHAFDCSLMLVTSSYLVRCTKAKLQLYSLAGTFEREWNLGSVIRYIKVVGGPPASEGILAGLKNGQVVEIFTNNPIPVTLVKQTHSIACLDISLQRTKLAAVDSTQRLTVYDLATKEVLYTESNVTSVAWNLVMDDMLAYTGNNTLSVRHGTLKPRSQRLQGLVVGFRGSKIYCLKSQSIQTCNFPQSASLYPYIGMKNFAAAYEVACLGVTASDWLSLALSALANLDFAYAAKAFTRLRDFRGITLVQKIQNSSSTAHKLSPVEQAHNAAAYVAAYQGNFDDAALHWVNAGQAHLAVEMFTELRRWEDAKKWAQTVDEGAVSAGCREPTLTRLPTAKDPPALGGNHENCTPETQNQRSTTNTTNLNQKEQVVAQQTATEEEKDDLIFAAEVYAKAKQLRRAVELYGRTGALDKIISIVRRELPAADAENILRAAFAVFKKHRHFAFAREASQKLGDKKLMARLLVEHGRWEEAFLFANQQPVVTDDVHIPWADYLVRSDRFDEATSALKKAGRPDLALGLQLKLLKICLEERRYLETSRRCWACAREILQGSDSNSGASVRGISSLCGHPSTPLSLFLFCTFRKLAEIYLAYHVVLRRKDGIFPFGTTDKLFGGSREQRSSAPRAEIVFNAAAFLWNCATAPAVLDCADMQENIQPRPPLCCSTTGSDHSKRKSIAGEVHSMRVFGGAIRWMPSEEKLSSCLTGDLGRSILGLVSPLLEKGGPVPGVSQVEVLFALAETSLTVGAYKIGRLACQSLHRLRIPGRLQETIDSLTMILKSSPRSTENKRVLEETCSWCHAVVPLLNDERVPFIASEACDNCGHLRLREFGGFTVLGCIEFLPPQHASFLTEEGRLPDGKKGNNTVAQSSLIQDAVA